MSSRYLIGPAIAILISKQKGGQLLVRRPTANRDLTRDLLSSVPLPLAPFLPRHGFDWLTSLEGDNLTA